jgi:hypothetical protein
METIDFLAHRRTAVLIGNFFSGYIFLSELLLEWTIIVNHLNIHISYTIYFLIQGTFSMVPFSEAGFQENLSGVLFPGRFFQEIIYTEIVFRNNFFPGTNTGCGAEYLCRNSMSWGLKCDAGMGYSWDTLYITFFYRWVCRFLDAFSINGMYSPGIFFIRIKSNLPCKI